MIVDFGDIKVDTIVRFDSVSSTTRIVKFELSKSGRVITVPLQIGWLYCIMQKVAGNHYTLMLADIKKPLKAQPLEVDNRLSGQKFKGYLGFEGGAQNLQRISANYHEKGKELVKIRCATKRTTTSW